MQCTRPICGMSMVYGHRPPFLIGSDQLPENRRCESSNRQNIFNGRHTSKHAIIMPHAGAIFAILGITPAYNAATPSVLTISFSTAAVPAEDPDPPSAPVMSSACLRVFRTSKGEVRSAAVVPLSAPLTKATLAPS